MPVTKQGKCPRQNSEMGKAKSGCLTKFSAGFFVLLIFLVLATVIGINYETEDPDFYYRRGVIYESLGQTRQAQEDYRKSLALGGRLKHTPQADVKEGADPVIPQEPSPAAGRIQLFTLCQAVDERTFEPIQETHEFSSQSKQVICLLHLDKPTQKGDNLRVSWYYLGAARDQEELYEQQEDQEPGYDVFWYVLEPEDWMGRIGYWRVEVSLGEESHSQEFWIAQE